MLSNLIKELQELIPLSKWKETFKYRGKVFKNTPAFFFSLNLFENSLWSVTITHDWHKLSDKGLEHQFYGDTPQKALRAAVDYIKEHLQEYRACCK